MLWYSWFSHLMRTMNRSQGQQVDGPKFLTWKPPKALPKKWRSLHGFYMLAMFCLLFYTNNNGLAFIFLWESLGMWRLYCRKLWRIHSQIFHTHKHHTQLSDFTSQLDLRRKVLQYVGLPVCDTLFLLWMISSWAPVSLYSIMTCGFQAESPFHDTTLTLHTY